MTGYQQSIARAGEPIILRVGIPASKLVIDRSLDLALEFKAVPARTKVTLQEDVYRSDDIVSVSTPQGTRAIRYSEYSDS